MLKRELIEKWCRENDGFCDSKELCLKLHKWLKNATNEEQQILLSLFEFSHYFSKKKVFAHFKELYENLCDSDDYTLFSAIESQDYRHNSSHGYLHELYMTLKLNDYNIIHSIPCFPITNMRYIHNVVFVDDIIGTGKTVTDFFKKIINYLSGKKIYLWVICITNTAYKEIKEYADDNNLEIIVQEKIIEEKAFKEGYIFKGEDSSKKKKKILEYEKRMWGKNSKYLLGRYDSQCLVSFYNDTPNNTLSSFWYNKGPYKAIFHRQKKEKPKWFSDREKDRREENYKRKKENYG